MQSKPSLMRNSPIVIVEDDKDDCEMLVKSFQAVGVQNEFRCFDNPVEALKYLRTTKDTPFIIISDINMPIMNGFKFKEVINNDNILRNQKIPFLFLSTAKEHSMIEKAFNLSVQGYFQKPDDFKSLEKIAKTIVEYWNDSMFKETAY